ncbi:DUF2232 domain-containing protein [Pseudorhodoplanes sp.]|jgi:hypothetical protein|uniref:DUF2232 domain-containing protein n=1 Tax=Pseudorhodoplanes sp. TaxID=1934341 RepID=UPI002BD9A47D|nr:DUF2232 domain-containing protein [Pseudorhodoplanes sp.]HWV43053.1 DUF2232 domain-containing protein [Pseudorhodoplanes sp.]
MVPTALIGLGAGAASALLMATMASRSPLALLLILLAPLPIMIAAIGWTHWTALFGALAAALALAVVFGEPLWIPIYLVGAGLPGWWLGYLALLARADDDGQVEWYPVGRLVVWCTIIASIIVMIVMWNVRIDEVQFQAALKLALERVAKEYGSSAPDFTKMDVKRVGEMIAGFVPPATAAMITLAYALNLYAAGRTAGLSGRLRRPWPDLSALRFPKLAPAAFAIALTLWFMPGALGMVGGIISGAFIMAYAMLGFAVLHEITRNLGIRPLVLIGAYFVVMAAVWPVFFMTMLGLADSIFDFRKGAAGAQPPAVT